MADVWPTQKAAALKILGNDSQVPDMPANVPTAVKQMVKAWGEFDKSREACEAAVLALQNTSDAVRNALKQFAAKIEKSDFGLNSKDKDELKKIEEARELLMGTLNEAVSFYAERDKMLDEIDKHLSQLDKYKQESPPI